MINKRGQGIFIGVIIALLIYVAGILFLPLAKDIVDSSRTDSSCSTPASISDGSKILCLMFDGAIPYFLWFIVSIAFGVIFNGRIRR